jgi:hypothetical protein
VVSIGTTFGVLLQKHQSLMGGWCRKLQTYRVCKKARAPPPPRRCCVGPGLRNKFAQGWPKSWPKPRLLTGIFIQKAGPSRRIRTNPVKITFEEHLASVGNRADVPAPDGDELRLRYPYPEPNEVFGALLRAGLRERRARNNETARNRMRSRVSPCALATRLTPRSERKT